MKDTTSDNIEDISLDISLYIFADLYESSVRLAEGDPFESIVAGVATRFEDALLTLPLEDHQKDRLKKIRKRFLSLLKEFHTSDKPPKLWSS